MLQKLLTLDRAVHGHSRASRLYWAELFNHVKRTPFPKVVPVALYAAVLAMRELVVLNLRMNRTILRFYALVLRRSDLTTLQWALSEGHPAPAVCRWVIEHPDMRSLERQSREVRRVSQFLRDKQAQRRLVRSGVILDDVIRRKTKENHHHG
ncbi:MAG TPA: hypothetical protein VFA48_06045 [Gammaproteobacteria bacterium]|nr:hypothetical protein [Gammaproteobacteria bacterium]